MKKFMNHERKNQAKSPKFKLIKKKEERQLNELSRDVAVVSHVWQEIEIEILKDLKEKLEETK